ncbi:hypothetical protein ACFE04_003770 [Oxalis oulophora]
MAGELEKPLLDPENFNRDGVDLERIPLEEVFEQLRTSPEGLTSEDAEIRITIFGPNKLEEKHILNMCQERDEIADRAHAIIDKFAERGLRSLAVACQTRFGVRSIANNTEEVASAVYLQVSIISQALIFVTRSRSWSFLERPGVLLMCAFVIAQLAFTTKKDYGKEDREAQWVLSQRSLQGLQAAQAEFNGNRSRSSLIAEQAKRRAEIARLGEIHTLRGHVESVLRLKNLDLNAIQSAHTV